VPEAITRRALLGGVLGGALGGALSGCRSPADARVLRVGCMGTLAHAPSLVGLHSGRFERALSARGVRLERAVFGAGPEVMASLLAGAIDVGCLGPVPAVTAYVRTRGRAVRVVSGAASGGAVMVVRRGAGIRCASDLRGRHVATPQLGNTNDLALRGWLRSQGMDATEYGGDVTISPMKGSSMLAQMRRGMLDAAWVAEPWGARLVADAGAMVWIDERTLWPNGRFATAVLVMHRAYHAMAAGNVRAWVEAHSAEVARLREDPARGMRETSEALRAITGKGVPAGVLREAWGRMEFTTDPLEGTIRAMARVGMELGMVPRGSMEGLVGSA
jgi:NitT/TauT family transport system substrate-binding protein